jgi:hypothetical protein
MLPDQLEEQFTVFYHAAYAEGEVDGKTKEAGGCCRG